MKPGEKVSVQPKQLFVNHPGIRFDGSPTCVSTYAPRGASGQVLRVSDDGEEALVEITWNTNPHAASGFGETWKIWVQRKWFGQLLLP